MENTTTTNATDYQMHTVCENCGLTLADHKGWHCVKGPKYFRTVADTDYKGELITK